MIVTRQPRVPWSWVVMIVMPAFVLQLCESVSGTALTFTLRKFTGDPALITLIGSSAMHYNFMISPYFCWKSDRIWTRLGRRRPFLVFGLLGAAIGLFFIPLAPSLLWLLVPVLVFHFFHEIAFFGPYEPLVNEVAPAPQRGRAGAIKAVFHNCGVMYFSLFLIGGFDFRFASTALRGDQVIYWCAAVLCLLMAVHFAANFRETYVPPPENQKEDRFSPFRFARDLFGEHQWRMVYLLVFIQISLTASLANLGSLLITEQFGYTKESMGNLAALGNVARIFVFLPIAGFLADRMDRMKMLLFGVTCSTLHPLGYWMYINFIAPEGRPSFWTIYCFDIFNGGADVMANIALAPLFFDFVPRNRMGTVFAGMTFARGFMKLVAANGVGLWVKYYTRWLLPGGVNDYSSGLLFVFLLGVFGVAMTIYVYRERQRGRLIEYGKIEQMELAAAANE